MSGWNGDVGVLDYAGGIVIHTSSGVSAFVVAKMLQKRKDFKDLPDTTHNLPLTMVGVSMVWVGWYSFNGGSGLAANGQAAGALLVTQISSCFAALTWAILSKLDDGRIQITHIASGALCGLAGITPGSGFVMPIAGVPIGILVGLAGWFGGKLVKSVVKLDDVLDVTSLQAFPGAVGSILVGFFATTDALPCSGPVFAGKDCGRGNNTNMGIIYGGNGELLGFQTLAVLIMTLWAGFFTWITMLIIKSITGLDVTPDQEKIGLDITDHGEKAYDIDGETDETDDRIKVGELCERAQAGDVEGCRNVITKMGLHPVKGDVDGRTGLHVAARYGKLDVVKMLVEEFNLDVNVADNKGQTPLNDAHEGQSQEVTDFLIANGASKQVFSAAHVTKMLAAAASGDIATVNQYMQGKMDPNANDYDNRTALHLAASGGHEEVVKLLLNSNADVQKRDRWGGLAAYESKRHGHASITRILGLAADGRYEQMDVDLSAAASARSAPKQQSGSTTNAATLEVLAAAANGDVAELKRLKKKGADLASVDYDGRSAIHQAAQFGRLDATKFLAGEKKINVNVQDNDHHTPLNDAVLNGHLEVAEFLKLAGATMITKEGELCTLANEGKVDELQARIVDGGVDANTADYDGRTAMHLAAANGNDKMIIMLANNGANVDVKDKFGGSPLDDAKRSKHESARKLLLSLGAHVQSGGGQAEGGSETSEVDPATGRKALNRQTMV